LVTARQQLVEERTVVLQQRAQHRLKLTARLDRARLKLLEAQIAKLQAAISTTLQEEQALAKKAQRLVQADGVGLVTAATCLALLPGVAL
jgi:transposase